MSHLPSSIQAAVIYHAIQVVESGDLDAINNLIELGFLPEQLDRLRHLPTMEVARLITDDKPLVHISVDASRVEKAFKALSQGKKDAEMQDEFIRRGASASMMHQLFRMSRKQVSAQRALLGVKPDDGRPSLPSEKLQHDIYRTWRALKHSNVRQRYLEVSEAFPNVPLAVLYAVVGMDQE
jgi:hypothetical protein